MKCVIKPCTIAYKQLAELENYRYSYLWCRNQSY